MVRILLGRGNLDRFFHRNEGGLCSRILATRQAHISVVVLPASSRCVTILMTCVTKRQWHIFWCQMNKRNFKTFRNVERSLADEDTSLLACIAPGVREREIRRRLI
jgi:hypothetical protein